MKYLISNLYKLFINFKEINIFVSRDQHSELLNFLASVRSFQPTLSSYLSFERINLST